MLARYVQKGDAIDYRPTEAVAAGDVVIIADLIGIARLDIEAGTLGSLAVVGVFDVVKADGAIPSGSTVYWDAERRRRPRSADRTTTSARPLRLRRRPTIRFVCFSTPRTASRRPLSRAIRSRI